MGGNAAGIAVDANTDTGDITWAQFGILIGHGNGARAVEPDKHRRPGHEAEIGERRRVIPEERIIDGHEQEVPTGGDLDHA